MTLHMLWESGADGTSLMATDNKGTLIVDHLVTSDINVSEEKGCKVTWSALDLTSLLRLPLVISKWDETKDAFIETFKEAKNLAL